MKEITTKIFIVLILINIFFINTNVVRAEGMKNIIDGGSSFIQAGGQSQYELDTDQLKNASNTIYNTLLLTGMAIAVIASSILGIKFMIGSVEEKAQIKEALVPFVIGCIVIFGAFGIWKIAIIIGNKL